MTPTQHQEMVDVAKVHINEYFDHYLTDVFPKQMDRLFKAHNQDAEAHGPLILPLQKSERRGRKFVWMILGGAAVLGGLVTLAADHAGAILRVLAG
jgi:predicted phage gp36 major capsid-like protein